MTTSRQQVMTSVYGTSALTNASTQLSFQTESRLPVVFLTPAVLLLVNPLGVTQVGAKEQVKNAFSDASRNLPNPPTNSDLEKYARETARLILSSISVLFPVASSIQQWLYTVLAICLPKSDELSRSMEWTSPLGFPVSQQYRTKAMKRVSHSTSSTPLIREPSVLGPRSFAYRALSFALLSGLL
jgi:hypothetical protein